MFCEYVLPITVKDHETDGNESGVNGSGSNAGSAGASKRKGVAAAITLVILLVIAALFAIRYWYRQRSQSLSQVFSPERGLIVNQNATRGIAIPDEAEDTFTNPSGGINLSNSDLDGDSDFLDANCNGINNPVISPAPKWSPENDQRYQASIPESNSQIVDLQINSEAQVSVEMQDVELQSINASEYELGKDDLPEDQNAQMEGQDGNKAAWDMTPLGQ